MLKSKRWIGIGEKSKRRSKLGNVAASGRTSPIGRGDLGRNSNLINPSGSLALWLSLSLSLSFPLSIFPPANIFVLSFLFTHCYLLLVLIQG